MSLRTLDFYYSVIPMVPFICCSNNNFMLNIWFIKADNSPCLIYEFLQFSKYVTFTLKNKIFCLNLPMRAFATILKAVVPTKLTANNCSEQVSKDQKYK